VDRGCFIAEIQTEINGNSISPTQRDCMTSSVHFFQHNEATIFAIRATPSMATANTIHAPPAAYLNGR